MTAGSYAYDYAGRRVWRQTYGTGAAQTAYVYDEDGHLLAEHNATTGAATREYVWIGDMPIALADIAGTTTTIAYITTGQIDEPLAVTNAAKALIWNGYVDAFGNASTFTTPTTPLDMRLPGQSFQLETNNLSQNGWRDYDPSLGRYAEADPLGIEAGQNVYAYVDGDPLSLVDPTGTEVTLTCRPLSQAGKIGFTVPRHCSVFVWHWNKGCPPVKVITRQFSVPGFAQRPTSDPGNDTYVYDRRSFNNPGGNNLLFDIPVPDGMNQAQFDAAVINSGNNYQLPSQYFPWGPNSNTAANDIITGGGGTTPDVPWAWGQHFP